MCKCLNLPYPPAMYKFYIIYFCKIINLYILLNISLLSKNFDFPRNKRKNFFPIKKAL